MGKHLSALDYLTDQMPYLYSYRGHAVYDVSKCIDQYGNYFLNFYSLEFPENKNILNSIQFLRLNYPDAYGDEEYSIKEIAKMMDEYVSYLIEML